jgi:hypothetical protein
MRDCRSKCEFAAGVLRFVAQPARVDRSRSSAFVARLSPRRDSFGRRGVEALPAGCGALVDPIGESPGPTIQITGPAEKGLFVVRFAEAEKLVTYNLATRYVREGQGRIRLTGCISSAV